MVRILTTAALIVAALVPSLVAAQQKLVIDPALPSALQALRDAAPPPLGTPTANGLALPDTNSARLIPSLTPSRAPEPIPNERRQEPVPTLRLRLPL